MLAFQFLFADLEVPNVEVAKNRYVVGMFFTKYACNSVPNVYMLYMIISFTLVVSLLNRACESVKN